MLTDHERQLQEETGLIPRSRLEALHHALLTRSRDTRDIVHAEEDAGADERRLASLRGKAVAYQEAAGLIGAVLNNRGMKRAKWSKAARKSQDWKDRRQAIRHFTPEQRALLEQMENR